MAPLWRERRFWRIASQVLAVCIVVIVVMVLWGNLNRNLLTLGIKLGFDFLGSQASFDIGETSIQYKASDPYSRALLVGLVNSLQIVVAGLILTTIVGISAGVARLSDNWLVRHLALIYVETFRNTPLLLQLFFWYFVIFIARQEQEVTKLFGAIYLTNRGAIFPWFKVTSATSVWLVFITAGAIAVVLLWRWRPGHRVLVAISTGIAMVLFLWLVTKRGPFALDVPKVFNHSQIKGGILLSPEFSALLMGLTFYTGAFIAEIVRGGIQSVPKGQWEAAKSLGLKPGLMLRLVIFPQALRVIIPPLTSQYLNLAKNSSLAIAIGYPDFYFVASTTFNQTGRAVEVMLLIMLAYLTVSLTISLVMNLLNRTVQLK